MNEDQLKNLFKNGISMSEEICVEWGGHCYIDSDCITVAIVITHYRYCKHCGKKQKGQRQPGIDWKDV